MARIAIIGAGLVGLGAALFLARRGHQVEVLERDPAPAPPDAEAAFVDWVRRGVPQARQSHLFRGLSSRVLAEETPDLLAELAAASYCDTPAGLFGDPAIKSLFARRLAYEAIVRRAAERERGVTLHAGLEAVGLVAREQGGVPHVAAVRTEDGQELAADLVVDASGRWTKSRDWLDAVGAWPWPETLQETPIFYLTRWYRLRPGARMPPMRYPLAAPQPYMVVLAFPGDAGALSVSLAPSMHDPCRALLRDPQVFERILAELPPIAALLDAATPLTEPAPLARINNCHRRLCGDAGPIVTGFVLLGDAVDHTNPTLGRGVSLGLLQAQALARTAEQAAACPIDHAVAFDAWTEAHIGPWFASQVANDGAYLAAQAASIAGKEAAPTPEVRFHRAAQALAETDEEIALAAAREAHMLTAPGAVARDARLSARVRAFMERNPQAAPSRATLSRPAFEALATA